MKVKNSADFLDDLQKKLGVESDYAVGKALDIHRQQLSHYRLLKGAFDDAMCVRVAEVLELDSAYVMACMHCQRAKQPEVKRTWERLATMSMGVAAAVLVAVALPFVSADNMQYGLIALSTAPSSGALYIMSNAILENWAIILPLFLLMLWSIPRHHHTPPKELDKLTK